MPAPSTSGTCPAAPTKSHHRCSASPPLPSDTSVVTDDCVGGGEGHTPRNLAEPGVMPRTPASSSSSSAPLALLIPCRVSRGDALVVTISVLSSLVSPPRLLSRSPDDVRVFGGGTSGGVADRGCNSGVIDRGGVKPLASLDCVSDLALRSPSSTVALSCTRNRWRYSSAVMIPASSLRFSSASIPSTSPGGGGGVLPNGGTMGTRRGVLGDASDLHGDCAALLGDGDLLAAPSVLERAPGDVLGVGVLGVFGGDFGVVSIATESSALTTLSICARTSGQG